MMVAFTLPAATNGETKLPLKADFLKPAVKTESAATMADYFGKLTFDIDLDRSRKR